MLYYSRLQKVGIWMWGDLCGNQRTVRFQLSGIYCSDVTIHACLFTPYSSELSSSTILFLLVSLVHSLLLLVASVVHHSAFAILASLFIPFFLGDLAVHLSDFIIIASLCIPFFWELLPSMPVGLEFRDFII